MSKQRAGWVFSLRPLDFRGRRIKRQREMNAINGWGALAWMLEGREMFHTDVSNLRMFGGRRVASRADLVVGMRPNIGRKVFCFLDARVAR